MATALRGTALRVVCVAIGLASLAAPARAESLDPSPLGASVRPMSFFGTVSGLTVAGTPALDAASTLTAGATITAKAPVRVTMTISAPGARCDSVVAVVAGRRRLSATCPVTARTNHIPALAVSVSVDVTRTAGGAVYTGYAARGARLPLVEGQAVPSAQAKARWAALSDTLAAQVAGAQDSSHGPAFLGGRMQSEALQWGWDSAQVAATVQELLALQNPDGGFGLSRPFDTFQDGTVNPADTSYTVTTAGHVGLPLLDAYRHGAVPAAPLQRAVDSLLDATPRLDGGSCLAYSTSRYDASKPCVYNVSFGGAAFLRGVAEATGYRSGEIGTLVAAVRAHLSDGYDPVTGYWDYLAGRGAPQDMSHQMYTAISADVVSPQFAAVARMMSRPWWAQPSGTSQPGYVVSASMISLAVDCAYARLPGVLAGAELGARPGDPPFSVQSMASLSRTIERSCFSSTVQERRAGPGSVVVPASG